MNNIFGEVKKCPSGEYTELPRGNTTGPLGAGCRGVQHQDTNITPSFFRRILTVLVSSDRDSATGLWQAKRCGQEILLKKIHVK